MHGKSQEEETIHSMQQRKKKRRRKKRKDKMIIKREREGGCFGVWVGIFILLLLLLLDRWDGRQCVLSNCEAMERAWWLGRRPKWR